VGLGCSDCSVIPDFLRELFLGMWCCRIIRASNI
jgi:hypothetical protein